MITISWISLSTLSWIWRVASNDKLILNLTYFVCLLNMCKLGYLNIIKVMYKLLIVLFTLLVGSFQDKSIAVNLTVMRDIDNPLSVSKTICKSSTTQQSTLQYFLPQSTISIKFSQLSKLILLMHAPAFQFLHMMNK